MEKIKVETEVTDATIIAWLDNKFNNWARSKDEQLDENLKKSFEFANKDLNRREKDLEDRIKHFNEIETGMKTLTKAMKLIEKLLK